MSAISCPNRDEVEKYFLGLLPELIRFAELRNRHLPPDDRSEAVAESCAWSWAWALSAARKGRLKELNPRMLSFYARKMWRSGRRFAGSSVDDVLAIQALGKGNVLSLDEPRDNDGDRISLGQLLTDSRHVSPPERCRISIDYGVALKRRGLPRRAPECFGHLARDHGPGHVVRTARAMKLSAPRVVQLKNAIGGALEEIGYGRTSRSAA